VPMFVGLDWGGLRHAVCVVDGSGAVVDRFEVAYDRTGIEPQRVRARDRVGDGGCGRGYGRHRLSSRTRRGDEGARGGAGSAGRRRGRLAAVLGVERDPHEAWGRAVRREREHRPRAVAADQRRRTGGAQPRPASVQRALAGLAAAGAQHFLGAVLVELRHARRRRAPPTGSPLPRVDVPRRLRPRAAAPSSRARRGRPQPERYRPRLNTWLRSDIVRLQLRRTSESTP